MPEGDASGAQGEKPNGVWPIKDPDGFVTVSSALRCGRRRAGAGKPRHLNRVTRIWIEGLRAQCPWLCSGSTCDVVAAHVCLQHAKGFARPAGETEFHTKSTAQVPIAFGSMAFWMGKRAPEYQTHRWHVYLRGACCAMCERTCSCVRMCARVPAGPGFLSSQCFGAPCLCRHHSSFRKNGPTAYPPLRTAPLSSLKTCTGANNEDLTPLIERVIFQLHPDFNNPTRVIDTAPFHVSELGWGEFEVVIKVFFHEGPDTPIELRHLLALFPKTGEPSTKKPVVSEKHDEFVFNQPNEALLQRIHMCNTRLVTTGGQGNHSWGGVEPWLTRLNQHDELLRIQAAQRRVQAETELLKEEYARVHETHTVLQEEVKLLDPGKR